MPRLSESAGLIFAFRASQLVGLTELIFLFCPQENNAINNMEMIRYFMSLCISFSVWQEIVSLSEKYGFLYANQCADFQMYIVSAIRMGKDICFSSIEF